MIEELGVGSIDATTVGTTDQLFLSVTSCVIQQLQLLMETRCTPCKVQDIDSYNTDSANDNCTKLEIDGKTDRFVKR